MHLAVPISVSWGAGDVFGAVVGFHGQEMMLCSMLTVAIVGLEVPVGSTELATVGVAEAAEIDFDFHRDFAVHLVFLGGEEKRTSEPRCREDLFEERSRKVGRRAGHSPVLLSASK